MIFFDLVILALVAYVLYEFFRSRSLPPFIRTRLPIAQEVVKAFGPLSKGGVVYDLGCGDGRLLRALAEGNPDVSFRGVELRRYPYYLGRWKLWRHPLPNLTITRDNFYNIRLTDATHLYTYLYPHVMDQLEGKLGEEVRPGTKLVSLDFAFANRQPVQVVPLASYEKSKLGKTLYIYEF